MCYLRTPLWSRQFPQSKSELCNSDIGIEVPWQLTQPPQDGGHSCELETNILNVFLNNIKIYLN